MMSEDTSLLRRFVAEGSEAAFRELVRQRIDFVHATALRQVGGDEHLAREVAQGVFIDLARKARALAGRASLTGWFYTSTRFAAAKALRSRTRRLRHETEAHVMNEILGAVPPGGNDGGWDELRPVIDAAMHELGERDREAILLRYFEGRSLADVGEAIGLAENSARMRVERALEKLRAHLARRGVTSTAAALGLALARQPVAAAPGGLAASVAGGALAGAALSGGGTGAWLLAWEFMKYGNVVTGAVCALAGAGLGVVMATQQVAREDVRPVVVAAAAKPIDAEMVMLRAELAQAKAESARLAAQRSDAAGATLAAGSARDAQLAKLNTLAELQKRGLVKPFFNVVFSTGKLAPAFVELFQLSDGEKERLQNAVTNARGEVEQLALANATVKRVKEEMFVIEMPATAEGTAISGAVLDTFAQVLGPERNAAFVAMGLEQFERAFDKFGAERRILTVTRNAPATGLPAYSLNDERRSAKGAGSTTENFADFAKLAERHAVVAKLVPRGF